MEPNRQCPVDDADRSAADILCFIPEAALKERDAKRRDLLSHGSLNGHHDICTACVARAIGRGYRDGGRENDIQVTRRRA